MAGVGVGDGQGFNTQPPEGGCFPRFLKGGPLIKFQHTAARRRLPLPDHSRGVAEMFQHTAARRRLHLPAGMRAGIGDVSTHSRPKAAAVAALGAALEGVVSTHSRPKAAALRHYLYPQTLPGFNTQPPEGGCLLTVQTFPLVCCFNTQPPEGGCTLLENSFKIRQLEATFR